MRTASIDLKWSSHDNCRWRREIGKGKTRGIDKTSGAERHTTEEKKEESSKKMTSTEIK